MFDRDWLQRRAIQAAPFEACGFVMEDNSIVEIRNIATNPMSSFRMDSGQIVQKLSGRFDSIVGIWHTHPSGRVTPSAVDLQAISDGSIQPHWGYWIVTASAVMSYDTSRYAPQPDSFWKAFV